VDGEREFNEPIEVLCFFAVVVNIGAEESSGWRKKRAGRGETNHGGPRDSSVADRGDVLRHSSEMSLLCVGGK